MLYICGIGLVALLLVVVVDTMTSDDQDDRRMRKSIGHWRRVRRSLGGRW